MKFSFIFNVLALTSFSELLALPTNSDNYPKLTPTPLPSPPASNTVDSYQEDHDGNNSFDNIDSSCYNNWENHYYQDSSYPIPVNNDSSYPDNNVDNNDDNYSSTAEIDPYYIWSPRPRWGRYSAQNEVDVQTPNNDISPYYIWSPRPRWGRYSTSANDKTNGHYSQQNNPRYGHPSPQKPTGYSSGQHVQLHG